jgi:ATP-binding cassette subfamily B multidrug efflux pump
MLMKNNANQWRVFKRLMSYLKNYKWLTALALTLLLLTTVVRSAIPLVASYFIDNFLTNMDQTAMMILVGYYLMYVLQTIIQYLGNLFFALVFSSDSPIVC